MKLISYLLVLLFFLPGLLFAGGTGGCHCFRNRSFDPTDRYGADDYLLATSYNSLIASVFDISKGTIIMKKMKGGINESDLIIGLYIVKKTGKPLGILLSVRADGGSWQQILGAALHEKEEIKDPILTAVTAGKGDTAILQKINNYMLKTHYLCTRATLAEIRSSGLNNRESNLLLALHEQTGAQLKQLLSMAKQQKMSWSEIAHHFGLTPGGVGKKILQK